MYASLPVSRAIALKRRSNESLVASFGYMLLTLCVMFSGAGMSDKVVMSILPVLPLIASAAYIARGINADRTLQTYRVFGPAFMRYVYQHG